MKKNYKMVFAYDGTRYYGWEHQPDRDTVQGKIETVLTRMCNYTFIDVIGAGRTDAGVHARAMVTNAQMDTEKSPEQIRDYLNHYLPEDICCIEVKEASERFHARYKAVGKTYRYTCYVGPTKPVFDRKYVWTLDFQPDVAAMEAAALVLQGQHDYKSFCSNPQFKKSTVRIVDSIEIARKRDYLYFTFHGSGFLQNMVRILVGTLLEVGKGTMTAQTVFEIMEARDRRLAGPTAPPQGLCLIKVDY